MRSFVPLALLLLVACRSDPKDIDTAAMDGQCDWYTDADGDGYGDPDGLAAGPCEDDVPGYADNAEDCDDQDAAINPAATEACNAIDDDCDGEIDEGLLETWYTDADGDGHGDPDSAVEACTQPSDAVADGDDCDDTDAEGHPGAAERCDGVDNDCDGEIP